MPGPTTEVLSDDLKELKADVHALAVDAARFEGEVRVYMRVSAWAGALAVISAASAIWWASALTSKVDRLADAVARIESRQAAAAPKAAPPAKAERDEAVRPAAIPGPAGR